MSSGWPERGEQLLCDVNQQAVGKAETYKADAYGSGVPFLFAIDGIPPVAKVTKICVTAIKNAHSILVFSVFYGLAE